MKSKYIYVLVILILGVFIYYNLNNEKQKYNRIQKDLSLINLDSLSKYSQLFHFINRLEDYNEKEFFEFLDDKNIPLKKQLIKNDIKLNSEKKSRLKNVFQGFYHIGPDGIDNNAENNIINKEPPFDGDIMLDYTNYFKVTNNHLYVLDNDVIIDKGVFHANNIIAKSLKCKKKAKIRIDTIDYKSATFKYNYQKLKVIEEVDNETLSVLIKDSLLMSTVKIYNYVYVHFVYRPIDYFYCDE